MPTLLPNSNEETPCRETGTVLLIFWFFSREAGNLFFFSCEKNEFLQVTNELSIYKALWDKSKNPLSWICYSVPKEEKINLKNGLSSQILLRKALLWSSRHGSVVANRTSIYEDVDSIPGLIHYVKDPALPWAVM